MEDKGDGYKKKVCFWFSWCHYILALSSKDALIVQKKAWCSALKVCWRLSSQNVALLENDGTLVGGDYSVEVKQMDWGALKSEVGSMLVETR